MRVEQSSPSEAHYSWLPRKEIRGTSSEKLGDCGLSNVTSISYVSCSALHAHATTSGTSLLLTPAKHNFFDNELDLQTIIHLFESHRAQSAQCSAAVMKIQFLLCATLGRKLDLVNYLSGCRIITVRNADNHFAGQLGVEGPLDGCIVGHTANL